MQINCPVCGSEDLIETRENHPEFSLGANGLESAALATIGAAVSKTLAVPPVVGGIAGALLGGVFGGLFSDLCDS